MISSPVVLYVLRVALSMSLAQTPEKCNKTPLEFESAVLADESVLESDEEEAYVHVDVNEVYFVL